MEKKNNEGIRINKYISDYGFCSRREADKLIEDERVTINNRERQHTHRRRTLGICTSRSSPQKTPLGSASQRRDRRGTTYTSRRTARCSAQQQALVGYQETGYCHQGYSTQGITPRNKDSQAQITTIQHRSIHNINPNLIR